MSSKRAVFDPSFLGFHLPEEDFASLGSSLNTLFEIFLDREAGQVTCDTKDQYCYLEHKCEDIKENLAQPLRAEFELNSKDGELFQFEITEEDLFTPEKTNENRCNLPFYSLGTQSDNLILGSRVMKNYYTVFDFENKSLTMAAKNARFDTSMVFLEEKETIIPHE